MSTPPRNPSRTATAGASSVRAVQAEQLRHRILEGAARVLARGVTELSMPAVARESGASLRTVYRYFPNKNALWQALADHYRAEIRLGDAPESKDDLLAQVRAFYPRLEQIPAITQAVASSAYANEQRRRDAGKRLKAVERALADDIADLRPEERAHVVRVVAMLFSSAAKSAFESVTGASGTEAAETVAWVVKTLTDRAGRKRNLPTSRKGRKRR